MSEILSTEGDRAKTLSSEENDLLQRSNKKYKINIDEINPEEMMDATPLSKDHPMGDRIESRLSYSQMTQSYGKTTNPLFVGGDWPDEVVSEDDSEAEGENEDDSCPNILLTREDKRRIRSPWKNAIIIKLFDKEMGYEVLMRRLKFKWQLKGSIALTDVGHAFYIVRFTSSEDYEFFMTQGPWMIGDSYLTIRKWIPNFIADEAPMRHLTAWVRIPNLSVEYFDKLILHKIGSKIGKVIKIDRNTESMDRGQYVRFCIEVDLAKPLLSKFKLNGRIWKIQYEGLKMICFKCGHLGHKEDKCEPCRANSDGLQSTSRMGEGIVRDVAQSRATKSGPEVSSKYGEWMLVSRNNKRSTIKANMNSSCNGECSKAPPRYRNVENSELGHRPITSKGKSPIQEEAVQGSRFGVLEVADMDTTEGNNLTLEGDHTQKVDMPEGNDLVIDGDRAQKVDMPEGGRTSLGLRILTRGLISD
ncbi:uncharacterized protein LOC130590827 [Beta vulgaris subsp. vulgaris]|uniref:uncharacterized protein LOC130590827 n=1 Tax=Beta vulgaris subsp. vulgaris TaxID=3555 RepID=UPI002549B7D3|nr:uncharacterized protein LOC130590827 [Beta vulgaris subsp. vulgaris]